jgi:hypothetical protein
MSEPQYSTVEGWAVVELFGHTRELGYVTTKYFGNQAMFHIETPAIPEREVILMCGVRVYEPQIQYLPVGSKVRKSAIPGKSRIVGLAAVFAINPCTETEITGEIGGNGSIKEIIEIAADTTETQDLPF